MMPSHMIGDIPKPQECVTLPVLLTTLRNDRYLVGTEVAMAGVMGGRALAQLVDANEAALHG